MTSSKITDQVVEYLKEISELLVNNDSNKALHKTHEALEYIKSKTEES